jgi:hypothetical protein
MFTIRIDNLDEYQGDIEKIESQLTEDVNVVLLNHGIKIESISRFPGRQDLFILINAQMLEARLRPGQRSKDKLLGFQDWICVNDAVNDVLDGHRFYAVVKSTKFIVRVGKRRRTDYEGGRSF